MTANTATHPRLLSISAVAKAAGCTTVTVRNYEKRGVLRPFRAEGFGFRLFAPEDVDLLKAAIAATRVRRNVA